jgi:hypothetical protein
MPLIRLLPLIIRLFPQLLKQTFHRGSIVFLSNIEPATDTELERELNAKIRVKRREETPKDSSSVIKVSEAIDAVEEVLNQAGIKRELLLSLVQALFGDTGNKRAPGQTTADKIAEKIRENSLRQNTARVKTRRTKYGRPAKGHGYGHHGNY